MKKLIRILLASLALCAILIPTRCSKKRNPIGFELLELKDNPISQYYDAILRVGRISLKNALKSRFTIATLTSDYNLEGLTFIEDGTNEDALDSGDIFVVPLTMPDWNFYIHENNKIFGSLDFWESIPEQDRWHPLKSEAMDVAWSIEVSEADGLFKPVPELLPEEWELVWEKIPDPDDPSGTLQYQKLRADEIKEEVVIEYSLLGEKERIRLGTISEYEFLTDWAEWTRKFSRPESIAGHNAVYWDMKGTGYFGWAYKYAYIDNAVVIEVTINSDPLEWLKTAQDKEEGKKTDRLFLAHGYGPVGKQEWQIMIEIRSNGNGMFHKMPKGGSSVKTPFQLTDEELQEIERGLQENSFLGLESRSGPPGGMNSFLTVVYDDRTHSVEMRSVNIPAYRNIEQIIRKIVLPKVNEPIE